VAANSLGMPDLGISTLDDVLTEVRRITDVTSLPLLVDIDTGWGSAFNIARTIRSIEKAGAAAVHTVRLTTSSAGYLFAAFLPAAQTEAMIVAELEARPTVNGERVTARSFAATIAEMRRRGVSEIKNGPAPDTVALSAPLFEADGRIVAAISVVGRVGSKVHEPGGLVERELRAFISRVTPS
jgi:hypothetical protein